MMSHRLTWSFQVGSVPHLKRRQFRKHCWGSHERYQARSALWEAHFPFFPPSLNSPGCCICRNEVGRKAGPGGKWDPGGPSDPWKKGRRGGTSLQLNLAFLSLGRDIGKKTWCVCFSFLNRVHFISGWIFLDSAETFWSKCHLSLLIVSVAEYFLAFPVAVGVFLGSCERLYQTLLTRGCFTRQILSSPLNSSWIPFLRGISRVDEPQNQPGRVDYTAESSSQRWESQLLIGTLFHSSFGKP